MMGTEDDEHIQLHRGNDGDENDTSSHCNLNINNNVSYHDIINGEDEGIINMGCPTNKEFRMGKYIGYCALGLRTSLHDSWEFDTRSDEQDEIQGSEVSPNNSEDDDENCNGEFVSFWGHTNIDGDGSSMHDVKVYHQNLEYPTSPSEHVSNGDNQRGIVKWLFHNKHRSEQQYTLVRRRSSSKISQSCGRGHSDSAEEISQDEYLLLASSSTDCILQLESTTQTHCKKKHSDQEGANGINHVQIRCKSQQSGDVMSLPMIRPLFHGSVRCFIDSRNRKDSSNQHEDDDECDSSEYDVSDMSIRRDRAAVIQSISLGIVGTTDDTLLSDANCGDTIPNRDKRFLSRFIHRFNRIGNQSLIAQLHCLLQKEDWSLATILLQSNPELAETWHHVDRLYDGRYGGAALPIHAACALRPPPSFIEMLATLYPKGLLEKDKAFERVPLHVACRGVAESGVIRVLCEMEPKCVDERDTYKRVALHYLVKNYFSFGEDDGEISMDGDDSTQKKVTDEDGMNVMQILIDTNSNCVRAADHRGWLPLHVACSSSARKGMIRVIRLLLAIWPESIHVKTDKENDALACVTMAGLHHPTKDRVIALLQEAKSCPTAYMLEFG